MLTTEKGKALTINQILRLSCSSVGTEHWTFLFEIFCSHFYLWMISPLPHSFESLMPFSVEQNLCLGFVAVPKYSQDKELSPDIELFCCQTMWVLRNKRFSKRLSWLIIFFPFTSIPHGITWLLWVPLQCFLLSKLFCPQQSGAEHVMSRGS